MFSVLETKFKCLFQAIPKLYIYQSSLIASNRVHIWIIRKNGCYCDDMKKLTGTKRRPNNIAKNEQESRSSNGSWPKKKKKKHKISRQPYRDTCDKRNDWFFSHSLQGLKSKE